MSKKHRVKTHYWENGILNTLEHFFESLEEASLFGDNVDAHTVKIYDENNNLISNKQSNAVPHQVVMRDEGYSYDTSYA
jgi:hypothetical protein